jgi:hypothetical protein
MNSLASRHLGTPDIHGGYSLPKGYRVTHVPTEAIVNPPENDHACTIPSSYNRKSSLIAIGQILFAAASIYKTRGDQLSRYGYVAFGLTVTPYIVMSLVNLLGSLLYPEYSESYLVESLIMDEARRRGGKFPCTVGILAEKDVTFTSQSAEWTISDQPVTFNKAKDGNLMVDLHPRLISESAVPKTIDAEYNLQGMIKMPKVIEQQSDILQTFRVVEAVFAPTEPASSDVLTMLLPNCAPFKRILFRKLRSDYAIDLAEPQSSGLYNVEFANQSSFSRPFHLRMALTLLVAAIPFAIIGWVSGFRPGSSTYAQRVWIMTWLSLGQSYVLTGTLLGTVVTLLLETCLPHFWVLRVEEIARYVLLCSPGLGAFVVIGQMMKAYGIAFH